MKWLALQFAKWRLYCQREKLHNEMCQQSWHSYVDMCIAARKARENAEARKKQT